MGFTLDVRAGQVAALLDCPAGWQVRITNDPGWTARIEAQAIVGAAALDASEIEKLIALAPEPPAVQASSLDGHLSVSGRLTIMRDGALTPYPWRPVRLSPKTP